MVLSASEHVGSIAVAWNESYVTMRRFCSEHSADKAGALAQLEPLVARATTLGSQIVSWFDSVEEGILDEITLTSRVRAVSSKVDAIVEQAAHLGFPPQDVQDYQARAQSLFLHLSNMTLYYSERGVSTWPEKNRSGLMTSTAPDFLADLRRLEFEREKLH